MFSTESQDGPLAISVMALVPQYLSVEEEAQVHQQFLGDIWRRNKQVL